MKRDNVFIYTDINGYVRFRHSLPITSKWKDIKGWEGYYMVSNDGLIMSLERTQLRTMPNGSKRRIGVSRKLLRPRKLRNGYLRVCLTHDDVKEYALVHVLVANAFLPEGHEGLEVNHKDGNKQNNHASNLEFVTHQENMAHYHNQKRL